MNFLARFFKQQPLCGIHSVKEFQAALDRERARSDRTGNRFSVVVFHCADMPGEPDPTCRLPEALVRRIRATDLVGWFDGQNIAVLLPDTEPENACRFANNAFEHLVGLTAPPVEQIFTYPSDILDGGSRNDSRTEYLQPWELPPGDDPRSGSSRMDTSPFPVLNDRQSCSEVTNGLEPHLGQRLPVWKRACDLALCTVGLLFLWPVFALIAIFIKCVSPGPVFFKQQRVGYLGKPFKFWKYRTMKLGAEADSHEDHVKNLITSDTPMQKLKNDPRIIPFGNFFRKAGLDELPQLINVFRGEMSLVGPRPCLPYEFNEYLLWHKRRFYTLPGMTGLWQVEGKNRLTFSEMIRLDIAYEQKRSLWLDLKIILKTIPAVGLMVTED